MKSPVVKIDARQITDWDSFHSVFQQLLGFPDFYGQNMNAWIDCMSCLDDPRAEMTTVHVPLGTVLTIQLEHVKDFAERCREQYDALVECSAFVNWCRIEKGYGAVIALAFHA